ncbi:pyrimidine utilization protein D [Parablastomonas sp. CN1-191]|uniref:pyrimidine utilization protein D n=1 Tax=Parablastomonas sp. CN1-191 TaxID=3400908 RepID=UPI003BF806DB
MAEAAGLYYEEHGSGPPLILSSGLGGSAAYWAPNIAELAAHFRVIAYDHRGTGRSHRALPEAVSLADLGQDIVALIDALNLDRALVLGHAIGGLAALEAARSAPHSIARIAVINGWASLDPQTERCFDVRLALLRRAGVAAYLQAQPLFLFPPQWLSDHDAELRAESAHQLAAWPGDATIEKRIAAARAFDCRDWAGAVGAPVLLACAADDLLVPAANTARLADLLPHSRVAARLWGGHALNITDPTILHDVVAFFRS